MDVFRFRIEQDLFEAIVAGRVRHLLLSAAPGIRSGARLVLDEHTRGHRQLDGRIEAVATVVQRGGPLLGTTAQVVAFQPLSVGSTEQPFAPAVEVSYEEGLVTLDGTPNRLLTPSPPATPRRPGSALT